LRPFISVTLLGHTFPAFLDTGSSVSILGDDVIKVVNESGVKCRKLSKEIRFLKGACHAERVVTLKCDFTHGMKKHSFLLVPGAIKSILLGRDFIGPAKISVHIGNGGWSVGQSNDIIPFIPSPECFLLSTVSLPQSCVLPISPEDSASSDSEIEEIMVTDLYKSPAHVLANWDHPGFREDEDDHLPEEIISPSDDVNFPLKAPTYLDDGQKSDLHKVIAKFQSIFTKSPGWCSLYEHTIDTGNHKPCYSNLRPMNQAKRQIFDKYFFELVKFDVIERSRSPWSSSAFLVPKSDGSQRFVVDYKPLNKITVPDLYPMSRIDDMLAILGQSKFFSTFDLSKGFYQIKMAEQDKQKTAFISHHGLWQFKRLPMGLSNSPATFVRCIDQVLGDLKWTICAVYFDDIIIFSSTFEEHLKHIDLVLSRLKDAGLTINPSKVQLCRQRLKFLGHIIEPGKCFPNPEKVSVLHSYPIPKHAKHVQQFLGLVGYYRKFIPDFSKFAKPLHDLMKKGQKFEWTFECQNGFDSLRTSLTDLTTVYLPDLNMPFIIQCDASEVGLGAVLIQEKEGVRYPLWFASRSFRPAETRYSVSEKECLAVLWAIEKFRGFVEYSRFVVETDHQALSWLSKIKEPSGRLARWFMTLQMYDFEVRYKPGDSPNMRGADALSRIPSLLFVETEDVIYRPEMISEQRKDESLYEIISYINGSLQPVNKLEEARLRVLSEKSFLAEDGLLMRYVGPQGKPWEDESLYWRVWVPYSLKQKVMTIFHDTKTAGHLGIRKTFHRLENRVYWKNMRKDIVSFVNHCIKCQSAKSARIPPYPASSFVSESPWEVISIDLMGPYPKGSNQSTFLLVVVDLFTKYVELFPLRQAKTNNVTDKLWQVCCRWGVPKVILSDNGTQFTSTHYSDWCKLLGIKPFFISAYHPQANQTERYNQTLKSMIIATLNKCKDWDRHLPELAFALRTAQNDSTKFSPDYLNTGRYFRTPFDNQIDICLPSSREIADMGKRIRTIQCIARDNLQQSRDSYLGHYNIKTKERDIAVGDKVWMKSHFLSDASKGFTSKLAPRREGPFLVTEKLSDRTFNLKSIESGQVVAKVHINELSPYLEPIQDVQPQTSCSLSPQPKEPSNGSPSVLHATDVLSRTDGMVSPNNTSFPKDS
jgi:hypothetical protein